MTPERARDALDALLPTPAWVRIFGDMPAGGAWRAAIADRGAVTVTLHAPPCGLLEVLVDLDDRLEVLRLNAAPGSRPGCPAVRPVAGADLRALAGIFAQRGVPVGAVR